MNRIAEWFECDADGYPEEESLERLRALGTSPLGMEMWEAARFLVFDFPEISNQIACCRVEVRDDESEPVKRIEFVTGGWSGAEELIGVMLKHFWVSHMHDRWERGGLFTFEVPLLWLTDDFATSCHAARAHSSPSTALHAGDDRDEKLDR